MKGSFTPFTPQSRGTGTIDVKSNDKGVDSSREKMAPLTRASGFGESTTRKQGQASQGDALEEIIMQPGHLYYGLAFLMFSYMFLLSRTIRFRIYGSITISSLSILGRPSFLKEICSSLPFL